MTTTTSVTSGTSISTTPSTTTSSTTQTYSSDLFLKLLTTQLSNQDPSSPMDSAAMVEQTAQLASMEQLTTMSTTATNSYNSQMQATATTMLGKTVSWTDSDGNPQSGTVSAISFADATDPSLTVGSSTVSLSDVTGVAETASSSSSS